jgi:ABC-type Fe3+ transport system substrate-binding protein
VGLSFEYRANKTKKDGAPIDIVFPGKAWAGMWKPRPF